MQADLCRRFVPDALYASCTRSLFISDSGNVEKLGRWLPWLLEHSPIAQLVRAPH